MNKLTQSQQANLNAFYALDTPDDVMALLIGGSTLYGLNNADSDLDLRGVFALTDPVKIMGLDIYGRRSYENFVVNNEDVDAALYDLRKFLYLLNKTNTQVVEILYADPDDFISCSPEFKELMNNRHRLVNTKGMFNSLSGYIQGERRLMNGERTGKLGGKRKAALEKYGYSYKNLVQIVRLAYCGSTLFTKGYYPTNIKKDNVNIWTSLMKIKEEPETYTLAQAEQFVDDVDASLKEAYDARQYEYEFDVDYANQFLIDYYFGKSS